MAAYPFRVDTMTAPLPPTAHLPEYADFPVRYIIGSRSYALTHASTLAEARAVHQRYTDNPASRDPGPLLAEHVAPDLTTVVCGPVAGGTWGGRCASSRWISDLDGAHRLARQVMCALAGQAPSGWQQSTFHDRIARLQSWWVHEFDSAQDQGGFRVECQQEFRHEGPCAAAQWRWDAVAAIPLPDADA